MKDNDPHLKWVSFAVPVLVAGIFGYLYWNGPVSSSDHAAYGPQCRDWISRTMADGRPAHVVDAWRRRGHLVFAVTTQDRAGSFGSIDLCVIDRGRRNMQKPSILDTSWRRWP